jgi:hypothetical protein
LAPFVEFKEAEPIVTHNGGATYTEIPFKDVFVAPVEEVKKKRGRPKKVVTP